MKKTSSLASIPIVLAVLFSSSFIPVSSAMGVPPGTCPNEYDGPIASLKVTPYLGVTLNPTNAPRGLTFEELNTKSYTAQMTITTPAKSSTGNSRPGEQWWDANYFGYFNGACTTTVNPDERVKVTTRVSMAATLNPHAPNMYTTSWYTWNGNTVSYDVYWVPSPSFDIFIGVGNYNMQLAWGQSITTKIYVASIQNYHGIVSLMSTGPNGLTMSVNPSTVTLSRSGVETATLRIHASSFIAKGTYALEVTDKAAHCVTCTDNILVTVK